ncbi:MAG TPA: SRPBCC family protein [Streptosporangiaceae bacterium]|nr:SRPBCC family protein [Streptosporangiaceae bacterium]
MTETLTLRREYPVPPQQVYDAWTDERLLRQWFGCGQDMLWTIHEWDVRPGGALRVSLEFETGPFEVTGQFLVVDPPHRLRYQWQGEQVVDVCIEECPGGSRLTLIHSGLSEMELPIVTAGWTFGLDQLRQASAATAAGAG